MIEGLIAFAVVIMTCLLGVRVGFSVFLVGFIATAIELGIKPASVIAEQEIVHTGMNYGLSVIPLFVLMGAFVYHSNISGDLYNAMHGLLSRTRGGLAYATILGCAGFAAVCGSSLASAATMTKVANPSMRRFKYADSLSTGSIAAGGTLGILIPPSVPLIIYAIVAQQDVGLLFFAAVIPGLVLVLLFFLVIAIWVRIFPKAAPAGAKADFSSYRKSLAAIVPITLLFVIVLGGIYAHVFTPTEAAGVGAVGAAFISLSRGYLRTVGEWKTVLVDAAMTTGSLMIIIAGALIFAKYLVLVGLPGALLELVANMGLSATELVVAVLVIAVFMGMIFEAIGILLLLVPTFLPALIAQDTNLIWFGILIVLVTELGLITPPIGMNVFVVNSMAPDTPMSKIFLGAIPFAVGIVAMICLIMLMPGIATYVPGLM